MKFTRTKKLVCMNNKWWVWKTTITYNLAVKFAQQWYKTVLVDLDPQCNLSLLALWESFWESLFSDKANTMYGVLEKVIGWRWDVDMSIMPQEIRENLSILPWSIKLSAYEDLLSTAFNQAASWTQIWYFQTSAISRYLSRLWLSEWIDLFLIDVSPTLWLLNRIILLWSDYFVTPLMPDSFSVQWVENLWITLDQRKKNWKNTGIALAWETPNDQILSGEGLFLWYIINSYNQYNQKPIKSHEKRIKEIPQHIKKYISDKHCKNWLVEKSRTHSLMELKDYGELSSDSHRTNKAIFDLIPWEDFTNVIWTKENRDMAQSQFEELFCRIEELLKEY